MFIAILTLRKFSFCPTILHLSLHSKIRKHFEFVRDVLENELIYFKQLKYAEKNTKVFLYKLSKQNTATVLVLVIIITRLRKVW